jgi:hypothetical protein
LRRSSHGVNHGGSMIANDQWKYSCQCYHCYHEWVCDFMWPWKRSGNDQEHRVAKQKSSTAYIYRERGGRMFLAHNFAQPVEAALQVTWQHESPGAMIIQGGVGP